MKRQAAYSNGPFDQLNTEKKRGVELSKSWFIEIALTGVLDVP